MKEIDMHKNVRLHAYTFFDGKDLFYPLKTKREEKNVCLFLFSHFSLDSPLSDVAYTP